MNRTAEFKFRLYIAGDTQRSMLAFAHLFAICKAHLPCHHEIEVVVVFGEPIWVLEDSIIILSTLVNLASSAVQKIAGALSELTGIIEVLGLRTLAA